MTRLISTAHLTAMELPPPELVRAGARLGLDAVGVRVHPSTSTETGYPMTPGSETFRATQAASRQTGVQILDVEVFGLAAHIDRDAWLPVLEAGQQLGASVLNVVGVDPDLERFRDKMGALVQDARNFDIRPAMEPISYQPLSSFQLAEQIAEETGAGIMLDTLHAFRSGTSLGELAGIRPDLVTIVQICDGMWAEPTEIDENVVMPLNQSVGGAPREFEARAHRLIPGKGQFPLKEVLELFPEAPVSIEVPDVRRSQTLGLESHWAQCVAATRKLL